MAIFFTSKGALPSMKASFLTIGIFMVIACAISLAALPAAAQENAASHSPQHTGRFIKAVLALHLSAQQQRSIDAYVKQAHENKVATTQKMHRSIMNVLTPKQRREVRAMLHKPSQTSSRASDSSPSGDGIWRMHQPSRVGP